MRTRALVIGIVLLTAGLVPKLHAQEAEVSAAVRATLESWKAGEYEAFVGQYHENARGFFLDGGPLTRRFDVDALRAAADAGFEVDVTLRDLDVDVYQDMAVSVGYLEGALLLPGGIEMRGTWRYSETRTRADGAWKIVQFHVSRMDGAGP